MLPSKATMTEFGISLGLLEANVLAIAGGDFSVINEAFDNLAELTGQVKEAIAGYRNGATLPQIARAPGGEDPCGRLLAAVQAAKAKQANRVPAPEGAAAAFDGYRLKLLLEIIEKLAPLIALLK